jgi:tetratricopeptide (TPR) repeat protein
MKAWLLLAALAICQLCTDFPAMAQTLPDSVQPISRERMNAIVAQIVDRYEARLRAERQQAAQVRSVLAETEADLRRQVQLYRNEIEELSRDEDPRRQRALADYAAGHEVEAIETLIALQRAEDEADSAARASRWRQVGFLAYHVSTERALYAFEQVARYAPNDASAWTFLADLYNASNREEEALQAIGRSVEKAQGHLERCRAELAFARILLSRGRLREAGPHFDAANRSLGILLGQERVTNEVIFESIGMSYQFGRWLSASGALEVALEYYQRYLRVLPAHLQDPVLRDDARVAQIMVLSDATLDAVRLGRTETALTYSRQLLAIRQEASALKVTDFPTRVALLVSTDSAGRVELRFGNLERARSLFANASAQARVLAEANPSNAALQQLRALPLTPLALTLLLAGNAREADQTSSEALELLRPAWEARRADPQLSLFYATALAQAGLNKFILGERANGEALVSEGLRVLAPFSEHAAGNPEFLRGVWPIAGIAGALNVGRTWTDFLSQSADFQRLGVVTSSELDYMQDLRRDLIRLYPILPH